MKINKTDNEIFVEYQTLSNGDVFIADGDICYIKTNAKQTAVELRTGEVNTCFGPLRRVLPLPNATLHT